MAALALLAEGVDHVTEGREGAVDVLSFLEPLSGGVCFGHALRPCEVDEIEPARQSGAIGKGPPVRSDGENGVAAGRVFVHVVGPDGATLCTSGHECGDFIGGCHGHLCQPRDHISCGGLPDVKLALPVGASISPRVDQEVSNLLVVNLEVAEDKGELDLFGPRVPQREKLLEAAKVHTPVVRWTLHGKRLAAACLAIGKDAHVVPVEE
mmetsp:Transcript_10134/g.28910  ORF Transcript_10134/g.28910 Transcript_10134/m.28910 type:complete len:209 (-) Transcript_10134:1312-1938(-)